jgi:isochorismate synthase EntC
MTSWLDVAVAVGIGFIFFCLSTYGIKKYVTSAERERLKQAKSSILDILESRIINEQDITVDIINNLLSAIDRENSVDLRERVSSQSILQDFALRFEKSHHLDSSQKGDYCQIIEKYVSDINTQEKQKVMIPKRYTDMVYKLKEDINSNKSGEALEDFEKPH